MSMHKKDWLNAAAFGIGGSATGWFGDTYSDMFHGATGIPTADEKRNQQRAINDQIKAYKDQTELSRNELESKRNSERAEKRRVQEKQVRALRRNYRGTGFLGTQGSSEPDMNSKLGD